MKQSRQLPGWISPLIAFLFLGCIVVTLYGGMRDAGPSEDAAARLHAAISRAAVQCYALEGAYPPDLQYLRDNYSLMIDDERFFCDLDAYASNVMPAIIVVPLEGGPSK